MKVECPKDQEMVPELCNQVIKGALFWFLQVDIHVLDDSKERFNEFCPLFIVDTFPEETVSRLMKEYQERTA